MDTKNKHSTKKQPSTLDMPNCLFVTLLPFPNVSHKHPFSRSHLRSRYLVVCVSVCVQAHVCVCVRVCGVIPDPLVNVSTVWYSVCIVILGTGCVFDDKRHVCPMMRIWIFVWGYVHVHGWARLHVYVWVCVWVKVCQVNSQGLSFLSVCLPSDRSHLVTVVTHTGLE